MAKQYDPFAKLEWSFINGVEFNSLRESTQLFYIKLWTYATVERTDFFAMSPETLRHLSRTFHKTLPNLLRTFKELSQERFKGCFVDYVENFHLTITGLRSKHPGIKWREGEERGKGLPPTGAAHALEETETERETKETDYPKAGSPPTVASAEAERFFSYAALQEVFKKCGGNGGWQTAMDLEKAVWTARQKKAECTVEPFVWCLIEKHGLGADNPAGMAISALEKGWWPNDKYQKLLKQIIAAGEGFAPPPPRGAGRGQPQVNRPPLTQLEVARRVFINHKKVCAQHGINSAEELLQSKIFALTLQSHPALAGRLATPDGMEK